MKQDRKHQKPLRIHAETIRVLERNHLGAIAGGIGTESCNSGIINSVCCQQ